VGFAEHVLSPHFKKQTLSGMRFSANVRGIAFVLMLTSACAALAGEIQEAVHNNDISKAKKLIKKKPDLVFSKDENGFTPLHLAAANGHKAMAELLLNNNSEVNSKDNAGSTPLHQAAAAEGQPSDLVEMLLAHGATVNSTDKYGLTPLHYAILAGNREVIKVLLTHGANANAKDSKYGSTPLIVAVGQGDKEVVELLLAYGADVNASDSMGTPVAWAIHTNHADIVDLLRRRGGHQ
jgi:ankyrin repeat protein